MSRIEGAVDTSSIIFFRQLNGLQKESSPLTNMDINDINSDGGDASPKRTLTQKEQLILAILRIYLVILGVPPDQAAQGETPDTLIQKLKDHLLEADTHAELEKELELNELIAAMMAHHAEIEEKGDFNPSSQMDKKIAPVNRNGGNPDSVQNFCNMIAHILELYGLPSELAAAGETEETILQKIRSFLEGNNNEGGDLIKQIVTSTLHQGPRPSTRTKEDISPYDEAIIKAKTNAPFNDEVAASLKKAC